MTNFFSGKDGTLTYNGTAVAKVSNWSISANVDTLETTILSDSDRSYVPGLRTISGSATIFYYDVAPKPLLERIIKTTEVTESDALTIKLGWGSKNIQGTCIITNAEITCAVGEIMQTTIQFQFSGVPSGVDL
jgi:hypothetical protein